ncbi:unnamed protein product [Ectocarpus sp. 12 AP-2014]
MHLAVLLQPGWMMKTTHKSQTHQNGAAQDVFCPARPPPLRRTQTYGTTEQAPTKGLLTKQPKPSFASRGGVDAVTWHTLAHETEKHEKESQRRDKKVPSEQRATTIETCKIETSTQQQIIQLAKNTTSTNQQIHPPLPYVNFSHHESPTHTGYGLYTFICHHALKIRSKNINVNEKKNRSYAKPSVFFCAKQRK